MEVIGGLRGWTSVPIVVLSGRTSGGDKVAALLTEPGLGHPFQP